MSGIPSTRLLRRHAEGDERRTGEVRLADQLPSRYWRMPWPLILLPRD